MAESDLMKKRLNDMLVDLLKIDSRTGSSGVVNLTRHLSLLCREQGLTCSLIGPTNGLPSVVVEIHGTDNQNRGLILLSHLDTADWIEKHWTFHPLSGTKTDQGRIYGRGAIDCKSLVAIWLNICINIHQSGYKPKRNLCFVATPDEESGGEQGMTWLSENTDIFARYRFALNEGGGYCGQFSINGKRIITCQYGEKGRMELTGRGNAATGNFIVRENGIRGYCKHLKARRQFNRFQKRFHNCSLQPDLINSCFSTGKFTGRKLTLYPHPLAKPDRLVTYLIQKQICTPRQKALETTKASLSSLNTLLYQIITSVSADYGYADVFPMVTRGYSDSRFLRNKGIDTYGFFPLGLRENIRSMHAHDEYIHQDTLYESYLMLANIVSAYCC